jgi:hypothetical protein
MKLIVSEGYLNIFTEPMQISTAMLISLINISRIYHSTDFFRHNAAISYGLASLVMKRDVFPKV